MPLTKKHFFMCYMECNTNGPKLFLIILIYFNCMNVLPAYPPHVCLILMQVRRRHQITGGCELPQLWMAGKETQVFCKSSQHGQLLGYLYNP